MKIAILGFAGEGQSAYKYWDKPGNEITVCDQDLDVKAPAGAASQLGVDYLKNLDQFDVLVRTPALHPGDIVKANPKAPDILVKVTSVTNEFFRVVSTKNLIGVTGTKGKGTTTTLIAKMLEAAGHRVHLGGNIGLPLLDLLSGAGVMEKDWIVMELSSFQLIDLKTSPHIGVCLMVVPEHLDWHEDHDEYLSAKQQLFMSQSEQDVAIYYAKNENSLSIADASPGKLIPYYEKPGAVVENGAIVIDGQEICKTSEIKLLGEHNWQNACAAVTAVWQVTQDVSALRSVLTSFTGLEHRLEFVKTINDVQYFNDSYGTTPETAITAIQALPEPKVLILGGSEKHADFTELMDTIATSNVQKIILIGNSSNNKNQTAAPRIEAALKSQGIKNYLSLVKDGGPTMDEIVKQASETAQPGDVVLLSTACASFDIFKNVTDRGNQFKQSVLKLA